MLHGDPHIGNTYLLPSGEVGFLDWQVARRGNWSLDLGYFLQGALTVEDRRRSERDLLVEYRDSLGLPADELPSADEIWLRYRASVAHGLTLWLVTASAGEWQRTDVSVALAQQYSFAYADLDTRVRAGSDRRLAGARDPHPSQPLVEQQLGKLVDIHVLTGEHVRHRCDQLDERQRRRQFHRDGVGQFAGLDRYGDGVDDQGEQFRVRRVWVI